MARETRPRPGADPPAAARATAAPAGPSAPGLEPAVALLELDSIAVGIEAGDAMAKRAPVDVLHAGTVHPGRFLVLVGGAVADVEEALAAGCEAGAGSVLDVVLLPAIDPAVVDALRGRRLAGAAEALGIIETATVASIIDAADAGVKSANVRLMELRIADDLGGKAYVLFDGRVSDVEAAVEHGLRRVSDADRPAGRVVGRVVSQLHGTMRANLEGDARFAARVRGEG
ncbi:MAG: BMC domain-containing protein [Chloroflexi bacterium]|jgi:microcompartment protein CcmL/EutN|nr:BMC domain-containing protein [Chloroflexota bacterium]